jgi:TnpA family transposase
MKRQWTTEELEVHWTLHPNELDLIGESKTDHNLLGAACLLKYFQYEGRFPAQKQDIPSLVIVHLAQQLGVVPEKIIPYDWEGRMIKTHRATIRAFLGVRETTQQDEHALVIWLCQEVLPEQQQEEALLAAAYAHYKRLHIEPPTPDRMNRLLHTALHQFDEQFCASVCQHLTQETRERLDALLVTSLPEEQQSSSAEQPPGENTQLDAPSPPTQHTRSAWQQLKQDAGHMSVENVLEEIAKLERIEQLGLPVTLFAQASSKLLEQYRQRVAVEELYEIRRHPDALRWTLLAAYCWRRRQEIIDSLVDLLIEMAHHLNTKAERRVEQAFVRDVKKVSGKTNLLFRLAEAVVDKPDGTIREVVFPVVSEQTLRDLVKEYKSTGSAYQQKVQKLMRSSYSKHYRRILPAILKHLEFSSNNELHRPIVRALELLKKYVDVKSAQVHFAPTEDIPLDEVVPGTWRSVVVKKDTAKKTEQVNRINYELCVLQTLRDKVRSKEVWVKHANRFRNPDDDLPKDFETKRGSYYEALHQPQDVETFIQRLQQEMAAALEKLNRNLPNNPQVQLLPKNGGWISLSPLEPQPEPANLGRLKAELFRRWSVVGLLDMLKETDLRVHFTDGFASPTPREHLDRTILQKRLLLCLYGLGTNIGLKRVAAGDHGESHRELVYTLQRYLSPEHLRAAIRQVVNAIFQVRLPHIWGEGTTACASDSKKFGAFDQNLLTEWHARYRGPGVMIYWHLERKAACIYSQLKSCSSSEVAAMIEGVLRHCTDMAVDRNYVDTHGQSEVAFALCSLLGFRLLPRLKGIHAQKLYYVNPGDPDTYPNVELILRRPIHWDVIRQQYDEMIKYATALRLGTAETEAILRRFTRHGVQHPTYKGLVELGRVYKTIFLCEYLSSEALRREIHEGLNVVENWNSATNFILYGRHGEFSTNRREGQELTMLSLHLLQISLVYIQTLLIQHLLAEPAWANTMTKEDLRGLTPLIYSNVNPYGLIRLDMTERLAIERAV